jgi:hypothetical protein
MAVARRMPTAALVAVLAERGAPGDVTAEDLEAVQGLQDQESVSAFMAAWQARHGRTSTMNVCGNPQSAWEFYAAMQTIVPRLAREVVILRALAAHVLPCGHGLDDIVHGGPDLNGLPAIAQCGQCLANRQAAKAALPRTPETVLRAMLKAYDAQAERVTVACYRVMGPTVDIEEGSRVAVAQRAASDACFLLYAVLAEKDISGLVSAGLVSAAVMADYAARLAGTRPLDAPPMEAP